MQTISVNGKINENGKLAMFMGELNQFFAQHKNENVIAQFAVFKPKCSEALKGYYLLSVVPQMQAAALENGERKTQEQTEKWLRSISPICINEVPNIEDGKYNSSVKELSQLSNKELIEHIEFIKEFAAENYSVYIEDPKQF